MPARENRESRRPSFWPRLRRPSREVIKENHSCFLTHKMSFNNFKTVCCVIAIWYAAIITFRSPVEAAPTEDSRRKPCKPNFFWSEFVHGDCTPCPKPSDCKREQSGDIERCMKACGQVSSTATPSSNDNATRQAKTLSVVVLKTTDAPAVDNIESTRSFSTEKGSNSLTDIDIRCFGIGFFSCLAIVIVIVLAAVLLLRSRCRRVKTEESNEGETADERNEREMSRLASSPDSMVVDIPDKDSFEGVESSQNAQIAKPFNAPLQSTEYHGSDMNMNETCF